MILKIQLHFWSVNCGIYDAKSNKECVLCGNTLIPLFGTFFLGLIRNSDKHWVSPRHDPKYFQNQDKDWYKMVWIKIANFRQFEISDLGEYSGVLPG